jgi:hypothetical protein
MDDHYPTPLRQALAHLLGVARGFQYQEEPGFDLQVQADMMAEAVAIYDRIASTRDPVEAEAALAPIVIDEIIERADEDEP